jgi:hypothetical protein
MYTARGKQASKERREDEVDDKVSSTIKKGKGLRREEKETK